MKKSYAVLILICLFSEMLSAQVNYELKQRMDLINLDKTLRGNYESLLEKVNIKGSPYLEDNFTKGSIYTKEKTMYIDVPIRYNIYFDQIEFKANDNTVQAMGTPEMIEKVKFKNYKMVYIPFSVSKEIRQGFFLVLEEGKSSLYVKLRVSLQNPAKPLGYKDAQPAEFIRRPDAYYIRVGGSCAIEVRNKRDLLEIFPDHQKQLEAFIKKHKVKPNKPETLKELVQYYNSL